MKAWRVEDLDSVEGYATVVFAPTRNEAKLVAMGTDVCEDADYIKIRATRVPALDSAYRGLNEMDWYDPDDRAKMVELGWACIEYEPWMCTECASYGKCWQTEGAV